MVLDASSPWPGDSLIAESPEIPAPRALARYPAPRTDWQRSRDPGGIGEKKHQQHIAGLVFVDGRRSAVVDGAPSAHPSHTAEAKPKNRAPAPTASDQGDLF